MYLCACTCVPVLITRFSFEEAQSVHSSYEFSEQSRAACVSCKTQEEELPKRQRQILKHLTCLDSPFISLQFLFISSLNYHYRAGYFKPSLPLTCKMCFLSEHIYFFSQFIFFVFVVSLHLLSTALICMNAPYVTHLQ